MNEKVFFQKKMRIIFFFPLRYHYVYEEEGKKNVNLYQLFTLS